MASLNPQFQVVDVQAVNATSLNPACPTREGERG